MFSKVIEFDFYSKYSRVLIFENVLKQHAELLVMHVTIQSDDTQ